MQPIQLDFEASKRRAQKNKWRPRNCVWEITLACNLQCGHCGSRAGKPRADELTTEQALDVVDQMAELGTELITLSGGEPTVREDWDVIAKRISDRGILVNMVTNGCYRSEEKTREIGRRAIAAGMKNLGVSVDGSREIHDRIRGKGSFDKTLRSIRVFAEMGLKPALMTTVCQENYPILEDVRQLAIDLGASMWRLQLSKPMGIMEDENRENILTLAQFHALIPRLAKLKKLGGIHLRVGDSIGYYGPHEGTLRGRSWRGSKQVWRGCQAGMQAMGIEANGAVKGCLSLQADFKGRFIEGSLAEQRLEEIWYAPGAFSYNRDLKLSTLSGKCSDCKYAQQCRGGARCVGSSVLGKLTEDPYCFWALDERNRSRYAPTKLLQQSAAAAAAALLLSLAPGCDSAKKVTKGEEGTQSEPINEPEYGVEPAISDDYGVDPEPIYELEYGVAPEPIHQLEYGIEPEPIPEPLPTPAPEYGLRVDPEPEPTYQLEYGVEPAPIKELDYGLAPDPGAQEYGIPPQPDHLEPVPAPEYGVEIPPEPVPAPEYGVEVPPEPVLEYGVEVPVEPDYGVAPPDIVLEYGVEVPPEPIPDPGVSLEYGVEIPPEEAK